MKKKDIQIWFEDIKKEYDHYSNDNEMPEGDFNNLETEYQTLQAVLEIKD